MSLGNFPNYRICYQEAKARFPKCPQIHTIPLYVVQLTPRFLDLCCRHQNGKIQYLTSIHAK